MTSNAVMVGLVVTIAGCAARPVPATRVGSAEAAVREARSHGALQLPEAALHLRFAEEQVARARRLIDEGEHESATWLLVRAEADATVAAALAREAEQKNAAEEAKLRARRLSSGDEAAR
jgi:hypothetical protein